jgi:hypothetical protein
MPYVTLIDPGVRTKSAAVSDPHSSIGADPDLLEITEQ